MRHAFQRKRHPDIGHDSLAQSPIALTSLACTSPLSGKAQLIPALSWAQLPSIPDRIGFAGSFAGISNGMLLVAGGANFPDKAPGEGGAKVWHDRIFALKKGSMAWKEAGRLPTASGYGASLTLDSQIVLIGGGDARRHFRDVWRATWDGTAPRFSRWPDLPRPLAMLAAAQIGKRLYVAGGLDGPHATTAQKGFLVLDTTNLEAGWNELDYPPGPERFFATAGSDGRSFYLIGGARLIPNAQGRPQREWLRDAYAYTPGSGWPQVIFRNQGQCSGNIECLAEAHQGAHCNKLMKRGHMPVHQVTSDQASKLPPITQRLLKRSAT